MNAYDLARSVEARIDHAGRAPTATSPGSRSGTWPGLAEVSVIADPDQEKAVAAATEVLDEFLKYRGVPARRMEEAGLYLEDSDAELIRERCSTDGEVKGHFHQHCSKATCRRAADRRTDRDPAFQSWYAHGSNGWIECSAGVHCLRPDAVRQPGYIQEPPRRGSLAAEEPRRPTVLHDLVGGSGIAVQSGGRSDEVPRPAG